MRTPQSSSAPVRRHPNTFERWWATPVVWLAPNGDKIYIPKADYDKYTSWEIGRVSSTARAQEAH